MNEKYYHRILKIREEELKVAQEKLKQQNEIIQGLMKENLKLREYIKNIK